MGIFKNIFSQTKKPEGFLGKMMVNSMNAGHGMMANWGMGNLPPLSPKDIADLGCGGGKNAESLMEKYPGASMTALDYSQVSVDMATKKNAAAIAKGRCRILKGDVSSLPFEDESFDLATAFETIYFWPGPLKSFKEVYRVLRSGGTFMIVNECDGTNEKDQKWVDMIDGMTIYEKKELSDHLTAAGFTDIKVFHNLEKHWICFLAHKN